MACLLVARSRVATPGLLSLGVEQQRPIVEVIVNVRREARRYPCCPIAVATASAVATRS